MGAWDFKNNHVQQLDNSEVFSQVGSKAILLSVGPPLFSQLTDKGNAIVMGMVQQLSMQQQKQIQEVFEIGSERRYFLDNPHRNMLNMNRALISGPSILKILGSGLLNRGTLEKGTKAESTLDKSIFQEGNINAAAASEARNLWFNLASDLFTNPLGLMIEFREYHGDGRSTAYGAVYLQNCKVQSHGMSMQSQMWMVQEDVSMLFEHAVPLDIGEETGAQYTKRQEIMANVNVVPTNPEGDGDVA